MKRLNATYFSAWSTTLCVYSSAVVRLQSIGIQFRSRLDVLTNLVMKVMLPARTDYRRANLTSLALQQAEHNRLAHWAATVDHCVTLSRCMLRALPPMKVSSASTVPVILLMLPWRIA